MKFLGIKVEWWAGAACYLVGKIIMSNTEPNWTKELANELLKNRKG